MPADKEHLNQLDHQMFPKGMWHMIWAVVCMAPALAILLVFIAILGSQWFSNQTVLVTSLVLFGLSIFTLVTPTFLLSRGKAKWHGFLLRFNLAITGALVMASVAALLIVDINLFFSTAVGIGFAVAARSFYKTKSHADCVEYYRAIWRYRSNMH